MTLDEPRNHMHAAALERGDMPPQIPEANAAARTAAVVRRFVASPYLTDEFWLEVGAKCVANRAVLRALFDELDADPARLGQRGEVLKQQQTASQSDEDWFIEEAGYHKRGYEKAMAVLSSMGSPYAREYDADAVAQDREDDRLRERRQDEAASENAPRVAS